MQIRENHADGVPSPGRDEARARAERLLIALEGDAAADLVRGIDDLELVDMLFDRRDRAADALLAELSLEILLPRLAELASGILSHEDLLLDPALVAEAAWRRIDIHLHLDKRVKPLALWLRRAIEQTIAWARYEPGYCLYPAPADGDAEARIDHELARFVNELDPVARRIISMAWVRKLPLDILVAATRLPLEQIEAILESALKSATQILKGKGDPGVAEIGGAEFWRTMEEKPKEDGDRA